jgi:hypothetical protein
MCRLSWNLGASNSWNTQGLSRPVMELLYLLHLPMTSNYSKKRLFVAPEQKTGSKTTALHNTRFYVRNVMASTLQLCENIGHVSKCRHKRVQGVRTSVPFSVQLQSSCNYAHIVRNTLWQKRVQGVRTRAFYSKLIDGIIMSHDNAYPHVAHRCHYLLPECQINGGAQTPSTQPRIKAIRFVRLSTVEESRQLHTGWQWARVCL